MTDPLRARLTALMEEMRHDAAVVAHDSDLHDARVITLAWADRLAAFLREPPEAAPMSDHPYMPGTLNRFAHEQLKMDVVLTEFEKLQEHVTALRRALADLEAELRKERPGYHITDHEWADKLAAILAKHPAR